MYDLLYGGLVSSDFFMRHWMVLFMGIVVIMTFITIKYQCMTGMEHIKELETELAIAKAERIRERSVYMSRTRESAMQHLADSILPGLAVQEKPPYKISR